MFKFTLTIASSVFLLMSGAADLFAMELLNDLDDKSGKQLVIARTEDAEPGPINYMPKDVMALILYETSKDTKNPRRLLTVSMPWYNVMREGNVPQGAELHYVATNLLETSMNPFMQKCMHTYWDNLFYNGILRYTPTDGTQAVSLKFSDCKDGTFNLATCGTTSQFLVITESMDHFFKVGEENAGKTVILITPRYLVEQGIKSPDHPFASLMADWDADKAPVGMFWRWGNDKDLASVDYLTTPGMSKISSMNLYEHRWFARVRKDAGDTSGVRVSMTRSRCRCAPSTGFHVYF